MSLRIFAVLSAFALCIASCGMDGNGVNLSTGGGNANGLLFRSAPGTNILDGGVRAPTPTPVQATCFVDGGVCFNGGACCGFICCLPDENCCGTGATARCVRPTVNEPVCPQF
jgi:hypothetical protein